VFDFADDIETINDFAKDGVLAVQVGRINKGDEELGAVRVRSGVSHGKQTTFGVLDIEVLISELGTVDRFAPSAIASCEITTLSHEAWDDAMQAGSGESEGFPQLSHAFLARAECSEVVSRFWNDVIVEREDDTSNVGTTDRDVEVDPGSSVLCSSNADGSYGCCRLDKIISIGGLPN